MSVGLGWVGADTSGRRGGHRGSGGPQKGTAEMQGSIIQVGKHGHWPSLVPRDLPAIDFIYGGSLLMNHAACGPSPTTAIPV